MIRFNAVVIALAACSSKSEPQKLELVDKDLAKAGAKFAGWTAKGPADADVIEDLGGARIVTKKVTGFDLGFRLEKHDLAELSAGLKKNMPADVKVTFTSDTADDLEWTTEVGSSKSYNFWIHQTSSGADVTCYTPTPRNSEQAARAEKDACKSLAKK